MLTYMNQLRKQSNTTTQPVTKEFIPLEVQIEQLMVSLPQTMQKRDWSMADLIARLSGKFRDKPHAQQVGAALRQLGWSQFRDYSRAARGGRFWRHP